MKPASLPLSTLLGFNVGMIGDRIFRDAPALLLLIFMTNYLGIPPPMAGTAIFLPKLLIMFVDPLVGTLSDRLQTRWGRRRPLMFVGALLSSIGIVLFFHVPRFDTHIAQAAYMSLLVLFGFAGYSLFTVPYLTMASEIAGSDEERRKVMSGRIVFMAIGLSISAYAGGFVEAIGGGIQGYRNMSWVYATVCLVSMLGAVGFGGRMKVKHAASASMSVFQQFRLVADNKPYLRLSLVNLLQKIGEGVGYSSFAYFCIYVVEQPMSGIGLVVASGVAGQILTQPLWLRASRRYTPATLFTVGAIGWIANLIAWFGMKGASELWLIPLGFESGAAAGGFLMVMLGMLSNTLAADTARTGVNREGVYSGFWLATEKLGFATGALVVGLVIGAFGFVESSEGVQVVQTPMAIVGIAFAYVGINILIYIFSIIAIRRAARMEIEDARLVTT
jgi:GPH family glycoside/pentoside/hexuronide:cation symporter